jgi:branched-chain amino acid transport system permease protein
VTPVGSTPVAAARRAARARRWSDPARWFELAVLAVLLALPQLVSSFQVVDLGLKIALFATLVASYDVLIGYTGIVSFGHAMFFGLGAYTVALSLSRLGAPDWSHLLAGFAIAILGGAILAFLIGAFSLRVRAIFFAMITLAFAEFALILAVQLSGLTGGEDGITPRLPPALGRLPTYYTVLMLCAVLFWLMTRFVASPVGRTLQAIRDNALRAEALGYRTFVYQSIATAVASAAATILGGAWVMWVRYVNPDSILGIHIMLDILLMVIIGGIGTLDGAVIGAAVLLLAQTLLPNLRAAGAALFPGVPLVERLTDRWLLWFGLLFIVIVFFFPQGVIGTLRRPRPDRRGAS